jgi:hypothetical protein
VYIFAPPFRVLPLGTDKLIFLIAVFYITYKKKWGKIINIFKIEYTFLFLLFSYSFIRGFLSNEKFYAMYDFLLLIEIIPCSFFLYCLVNDNYGFKLDKLLITCSIIASIVSLFLILNPQMAYYLKSELLKYDRTVLDRFRYRGYGFSDGLFFAYPVVIGFSAGFIVLGMYNKKHYPILFLIPMITAIFSNARSGLVPIFAGFFLAIFYNFKSLIKKIGIIFVIILFFILFSGIFSAFLEKNEIFRVSIDWGTSSFKIIADLFLGKKTENFEILFGEMLVFPENASDLLFGSGLFLFKDVPNNTDIGYLLRLNFGGIVYSIILFGLLLYMFFRLRKINKIVCYYLFLSLLYCHLKSDFFIVNPSSRFFFLVYIICIINRNCFCPVGLKINKSIDKQEISKEKEN